MIDEAALENFLRVGKVSAINGNKARVLFDDTGITSGWLYVLQHVGANVEVAPDNEHTHAIQDTYTGGGSAGSQPDHNHPGTCVGGFTPKVGARVLVIFIPVFNGDGFILGGI